MSIMKVLWVFSSIAIVLVIYAFFLIARGIQRYLLQVVESHAKAHGLPLLNAARQRASMADGELLHLTGHIEEHIDRY